MTELHLVFQGKKKGDRLYWCGHELTIKSIGHKWVTAHWVAGWGGDGKVKLHRGTATDGRGRRAYATREAMDAVIKAQEAKMQQASDGFVNLDHWREGNHDT